MEDNRQSTIHFARKCAMCGQNMASSDRFCPACGWSVDETAPAPRIFQFNAANNFWGVLLIIGTLFAVVYRANSSLGLSKTYATFVGLPLMIGILTNYLTRPKMGLGMVIKITTIVLCLLCPLLGEGAICILMAAPIVYSIAIVGYLLVAGLIRVLSPDKKHGPMALLLLPFAAAALTNSPDGIRNARTMTAWREIDIAAPPEVVWQALHRDDLVSGHFPLFLRLGFPLPSKLERLEDGQVRLAFGQKAENWKTSSAILAKQQDSPDHRQVTFVIEKDGTMLSEWLTFTESRFDLIPTPTGTRLRQTTVFRQRLQPGLYWNPLEGFAMGQMHNYALSHIRKLAEEAPQ